MGETLTRHTHTHTHKFYKAVSKSQLGCEPWLFHGTSLQAHVISSSTLHFWGILTMTLQLFLRSQVYRDDRWLDWSKYEFFAGLVH